MSDPDRASSDAIRARKYPIEKVDLCVFMVTAQRVCTQISDLNHSRQAAINEKWRLNDVIKVSVWCAEFMEVAHQGGVLLRHRLIVIVDD
jgi:hypothetical protein